ncbi:hypothetical protein [Prosthecomicrobium sp. N25]
MLIRDAIHRGPKVAPNRFRTAIISRAGVERSLVASRRMMAAKACTQ